MQLSRARFLSTASTTHHGASGMCVRCSISSLALVYCSQRLRDCTSIGESSTLCVHRIALRTCRDDGDTPLRRRRDRVEWITRFRKKTEAKYFCEKGWTRHFGKHATDLPDGQITSPMDRELSMSSGHDRR